ncbi:MAG TPA: hypothetical protein EYG30_01685 [Planctomycetes bacterium]|jgi:hypothetical protein|nr:hypothetical protein [Planctomycetota bacterium]HIL50950.1 hypothetical protein [Planctomycetota bacterium]
MTEETWADEPQVPKQRRGLPPWLWFCGGGCLIMTVLLAVGGMFIFGKVKEMADPDTQWALVDELIGYDDRPSGLTIFGLDAMPGIDGFVFIDMSTGRSVTWMMLPASEAEGRDEIFSEDFEGGGIPGISQVSDPEIGEVVVQGRTLSIMRFNQNTIGAGEQKTAFVDVTPEEADDFWLLQVVIPPGRDGPQGITDEYINEFLAPFHIGHEREIYTAEPEEQIREDHENDLLEPYLDNPADEPPEEIEEE